MPGADFYNDIIFKKVKIFCKSHPNCFSFKTLGSQKFLSLLKIADAIIGNSSSGVIEMPFFKKPTINIGDRQRGRVSYNSIINVSAEYSLIKRKIDFIFSRNTGNKKIISPYKKLSTSKKILSIIKSYNLEKYKKKKFYDITY